MKNYDPYTYQPRLFQAYEGSGNPVGHINAVDSFSRWLKNTHTDVYENVKARKPELLTGKTALSGLSLDFPSDPGNVATSWGKDILDFGKNLLAIKGQQDLLKLNISRAEQGLPPIEANSIAPQVNVGISPQVQKLGMFALGAFVLVGVVSMMRRR